MIFIMSIKFLRIPNRNRYTWFNWPGLTEHSWMFSDDIPITHFCWRETGFRIWRNFIKISIKSRYTWFNLSELTKYFWKIVTIFHAKHPAEWKQLAESERIFKKFPTGVGYMIQPNKINRMFLKISYSVPFNTFCWNKTTLTDTPQTFHRFPTKDSIHDSIKKNYHTILEKQCSVQRLSSEAKQLSDSERIFQNFSTGLGIHESTNQKLKKVLENEWSGDVPYNAFLLKQNSFHNIEKFSKNSLQESVCIIGLI